MKDWIIPSWPAPDNVHALFTTRNGGVSTGAQGSYATFNLGDHVNDSPADVKQNRALLRSYLPADPKWLKQLHGTLPVNVDNKSTNLKGDAAFSHQPKTVCTVLVADCLPIFLCNTIGTLVGVIHAGWRGLHAGIIEKTIAALNCESSTLMAWLGPAIGPNHFEVGKEVREAFITHDHHTENAFLPHKDKWLADLFLLAQQRLTSAGVTAIYGSGICTFSNPEKFFSYRRDGETGRMAALIWFDT